MFCAISGNVPERPVISTKSGHLFEKSLVEKYVKETGKCPISGETLTLEDLLVVKANKTVKPRTSASSSIPGMLASFHDEWDALMLELHTVRSQLHQTRQELSHALYQHDAAVRVIAKVIRERDEARQALENAKAQIVAEMDAAKAAGDTGPRAKAGIPEAVLQDMSEVNGVLSKGRKKRPIPDSLATPDDLAAMTLSASHALHSTTAGGIAALDINPEAPAVVATAGLDGSVQVFDYVQGRTLASLEGHTKRLTSVAYLTADVVLSGSADKTVRVWRGPADGAGEFASVATLKDHSAEVVGVTPHPSRRYFVSGSADGTWAFYDLASLTCLTQVGGEGGDAYSTLQFHPDGLILGTGTVGKAIKIWEVRQQKDVATFQGHGGPVLGLAFSENGYHLASASAECVKLWDLRKLKNFKTLEPFGEGACTSLAFDHSGQYLAVGGPDIRAFGQKQEWAEVGRPSDAPKKTLCLRWGADARALLVGGSDHNLRVFTAPETK